MAEEEILKKSTIGEKRMVEVMKKIQQHIYCHPFYNWCGTAEEMKLLVVGDGIFARKFVDLSLQTGQMLGMGLKIYWCIEDTGTKSTYLKERPALKEFVDVDESVTEDAYATIIFKSKNEALDSFAEECRYIFVATEDENYNLETAELFKNIVREDCLASFVKDEQIHVSFNGEPDAPEYLEVCASEERIASLDELERMSFNTHWTWEGEGNLDYEKVKERFLRPYNYNASIAFVLSIPYKLKSVGIHENNPFKAAAKLCEIIAYASENPGSEEAQTLSKLAALEHRRWVMEKVTEGVVCLRDKNGAPNYAMCVSNTSVKKKDENGKLIAHPCIVKSTHDTPLSTGEFAEHDKWDDNKISASKLDELDKMSIELHRTMQRAANQVRKNKGALIGKLEQLKTMCQYCLETKREFDRYYFCIENVLDKSKAYAIQFETYEKMLKKCIKQLPENFISESEEIIAEIAKMLFPVLEFSRYRDYKAYDVELIKQIPFILTAKREIALCMPLGEASSIRGNNDDFFRSVASATALYASRITYLYVYEYTTNFELFESKLKAVRNYFEYRGKNCAIEIKVFVSKEDDRNKVSEKVERRLTKAKDRGYVQKYEVIKYENSDCLPDNILQAMENINFDYYDGTNSLTRSTFVNGSVALKISEKYPYFEFDSYNKRFLNCRHSEHLKYIKVSSFIQVEDMFALLNAQDKEFNYQDYADSYRDYWEIYCGDAIRERDFALCARSWTKVSNIIRTGGVNCLRINNKDIGTKDTDEIRVIKKMLKCLEEKGFLRGLNISEGNEVSVSVRDKKVKGIFVKAGDLLETYIYFEACRTGWFDDVQTGYKFRWEFDDITNELDCVLTKGYRSILVECKSTKEVEEGFYLTLDSLADHFGIGYKKVLILVTDASDHAYDGYVSRGKQMDIITLTSKEDMMNIGERLIEIMKK